MCRLGRVMDISFGCMNGSILGNPAHHATNEALRSNVEALQRIVSDWQVAYQSLNNQLVLALSANQALNGQVTALRDELRAAQRRSYEAERRALDAEEKLREAKAQLACLSEQQVASENSQER